MRVGDAADDRLAVGARARAVEGVRHFAAAFDHPEYLGAARLGVRVAFQHQRAGAFRHHEAVAILGEGLGGALRRLVAGRKRRQQREAHQRLRADRAVGADAKRGFRFAAPDRLDAKLDRARARGAGGRERNRRALGAEFVGQMMGDRADQEALVIAGKGRAGAQQVVVVDLVVGAGAGGDLDALRPFHLDRRHRHEQRPGEIAGGADAGLADRLGGGEPGEILGQVGGGILRRQIIDGAGDARLQGVGRKARDRPDAGFAGRELGPIVGLAGAERSDDAEPGHHDGRAALFVLR